MHQLFTPLAYLRIEHPVKRKFDTWYTAGAAALGTCFVMVLPVRVAFAGTGGILDLMTPIFGVLAGFFFAALTAISSMASPHMDDFFDGVQAELPNEHDNTPDGRALTRRRFLAYLFGYLTWASLALYLCGTVIQIAEAGLLQVIPTSFQTVAYVGAVALYFTVVSHVLITCLLGVHFLTDRVVRQTPKRK